MSTLLQLVILTISIIISFCISNTIATSIEEASSSASFIPSQAPYPPQTHTEILSSTQLLAPILTHLGFQELAIAVPLLSSTTWTGPFTIFAPSAASIHTCPSCSIPRLLQEHIVPGLFSFQYLSNLAFGTKIETIVPSRCVTVTSALNDTKIFVGGVEITRPDLFNNGLFVVHGLDGFVSHLSPLTCNIERMTSLSFPPPPQPHGYSDRIHFLSALSVMHLMITDAMLRLRIAGFSVLALAMRVKHAELVNLHNMTVFALDDAAIFSGGYSYVSSVRFHIVPNQVLMAADLERLPMATLLPTLEEGQKLAVTTAGGGGTPMRINYVRIKSPEVMQNLRIVVHGLFLPFPHVLPAGAGMEGIGRSGWEAAKSGSAGNGGIAAVGAGPETEHHHGM